MKEYNAYREYRYSCVKCRTMMAMGWVDVEWQDDAVDFVYCANHNCSEYKKRYVKPKPKQVKLEPMK
jgi:hypothetical protein